MNPELIDVKTSDGLRLHALMFSSQSRIKEVAAILVHGVGGNFYTRPLPKIAEGLANSGYTCLAVNTRGHDWVSGGRGSRGFIGSSFEVLGESPLDIEAFAGYLKGNKSYERIVLLGHSLGAVKALYYQSERADPTVEAIVAISPAFLSLESRARRPPHLVEGYLAAEREIAEGRSQAFIRTKSPKGRGSESIYTAKTIMDKYQPTLKFDASNLIRNINRPILVTFGSQEEGGGGSLSKNARSIAESPPGTSFEVIEGVGHYYDDHESVLASKISGWLDRTISAAQS